MLGDPVLLLRLRFPLAAPDLLEDLRERLAVVFVERHVDVRAPVARVEAPVARSVLLAVVLMADELLGRKHALALAALDTGRLLVRVQLDGEDALALAEALVVHPEAGEGGAFAGSDLICLVEHVAAEPFGVGSRYESARFGRVRDDVGPLELLQLLVGAVVQVDHELLDASVDLLNGEFHQDVVEDLGQAEAHFTAEQEAADLLALESGQLDNAAVRVRRGHDRMRRHRQWTRDGLYDQSVLGGDQTGTASDMV